MIYVLLVLDSLLLIAAAFVVGSAVLVILHWGQVMPFVPTGRRHVKKMMKELNLKPTDRVIDIGSGWGSLVFPSAAFVNSVEGIEKSYILHVICLLRRAFSKQKKHIHFIHGDALKKTYEDYDVVVGWWIPAFMTKLQPKLEKEMRPGTRVCSYMFRFKPSTVFIEEHIDSGKDHIYLYTKQA